MLYRPVSLPNWLDGLVVSETNLTLIFHSKVNNHKIAIDKFRLASN